MTYCTTQIAPSGAYQIEHGGTAAPALYLTQVLWQVVTWVHSPDEKSRCS